MPEPHGGPPDGTEAWIASEARLNRTISVVMRILSVLAMVAVAVGLVAGMATGTADAGSVALSDLATRPDVPSALLAWGIVGLVAAAGGGLATVIVGWARRRAWAPAGVSLLVVALLVIAARVG